MQLEELKVRLDGMSKAKLRFVSRMVESLEHSPEALIKESQTWITKSGDWLEHFGLALSVHHGVTSEPLRLESFERVFREASETVNWAVDPPGPPTRRFVDLVVDPGSGTKRLSLKSTAARNLSKTTVHISKLTEAAWIQDARTGSKRRENLLQLFEHYVSAVDAIMMLRAFREPQSVPNCYQLLEIPTSIFRSLQRLPVSAFRRNAPVLDCVVNRETVAKVAVDRSDAKITVRGIRVSACIVHAEWSGEKTSD